MGGRTGEKDETRPRGLDIGQLAYFVGMAANEAVMGRLRGEGFPGLRQSHGAIVQHLFERPRSIAELAQLLGISQQAASKRVAELTEHGYVGDVEGDDARVRAIELSERGRACFDAARAARRALEAELREALGDRAVTSAKKVLVKALDQLGGPETARRRRVRSDG